MELCLSCEWRLTATSKERKQKRNESKENLPKHEACLRRESKNKVGKKDKQKGTEQIVELEVIHHKYKVHFSHQIMGMTIGTGPLMRTGRKQLCCHRVAARGNNCAVTTWPGI